MSTSGDNEAARPRGIGEKEASEKFPMKKIQTVEGANEENNRGTPSKKIQTNEAEEEDDWVTGWVSGEEAEEVVEEKKRKTKRQIDMVVDLLDSNDRKSVKEGLYLLQYISNEKECLAEDIRSKILPRLLNFLKKDDDHKLMIKAVDTFILFFRFHFAHIMKLEKAGEVLYKLCNSDIDMIGFNVLGLLGVAISVSKENRDMLFSTGGVDMLVELAKDNEKENQTMATNLLGFAFSIWPVDPENAGLVSKALSAMEFILSRADNKSPQSDVCQTTLILLSLDLCMTTRECKVIGDMVFGHLVKRLCSPSREVFWLALRAIKHIVTTDRSRMQQIDNCSLEYVMKNFVQCCEEINKEHEEVRYIQEFVCYIISFITVSSAMKVVDDKTIECLVHLVGDASFTFWKALTDAIRNILMLGSDSQRSSVVRSLSSFIERVNYDRVKILLEPLIRNNLRPDRRYKKSIAKKSIAQKSLSIVPSGWIPQFQKCMDTNKCCQNYSASPYV